MWMGGQKGVWVHEWMGGWVGGRVVGWMKGRCVDECIYSVWMHECVYMDGWKDRWIGGLID